MQAGPAHGCLRWQRPGRGHDGVQAQHGDVRVAPALDLERGARVARGGSGACLAGGSEEYGMSGSGGAFTDISDGNTSLPAVVKPNNLGAIPGLLQGVARTVVSMTELSVAELETHLVATLECAPNNVFQDTQDAQIRAAKRQLGLAFVGALERLCSANRPLDAERWARALRTQFLLGELELLQVDCLNQLAILYFARNQHKRALKAVKAALKLCSRLEQVGIMTPASAAARRAALHLNTSDTLSRLKRFDEALHSANTALQLLEPMANTSVEEKMGAELRISAMHSVGIQRQNTGDLHGASTMLTQAVHVANAKLPPEHALRRAVNRTSNAVTRAVSTSRPPKVLPAIKKAAKAKDDTVAKAGAKRPDAKRAEQERQAPEQAEQTRIAVKAYVQAEEAAAEATKSKLEAETDASVAADAADVAERTDGAK